MQCAAIINSDCDSDAAFARVLSYVVAALFQTKSSFGTSEILVGSDSGEHQFAGELSTRFRRENGI